jgi:iron(III) transport system ATP-binding protein
MLRVRHLGKDYVSAEGSVRAIHDVNLDAASGEFLALLGPSGCGKTTTLRCLAGLERPDAGEIQIGDVVACDAARNVYQPTFKRHIGMVFQSYAIWPHLDVFENVAYPLRVQRPRPSEQYLERQVMDTLAMVGLDGLERRPSTALSGGQQQRVALARALVRHPRLLLLDEPLSNLDAQRREQMQHEIGDLVRRMGVTTVYVTHDQAEALAMADRVAVMMNGRVAQADTPQALYARPNSPAVAAFLGATSLLAATITELRSSGSGLVRVGDAGMLDVALPAGVTPGEPVTVSLRVEDVAVMPERPPCLLNTLCGTVERVTFRGGSRDCHVRVAQALVRARLDQSVPAHCGLVVWLTVNPVRVVIFRSSTHEGEARWRA